MLAREDVTRTTDSSWWRGEGGGGRGGIVTVALNIVSALKPHHYAKCTNNLSLYQYMYNVMYIHCTQSTPLQLYIASPHLSSAATHQMLSPPTLCDSQRLCVRDDLHCSLQAFSPGLTQSRACAERGGSHLWSFYFEMEGAMKLKFAPFYSP